MKIRQRQIDKIMDNYPTIELSNNAYLLVGVDAYINTAKCTLYGADKDLILEELED